MGRIAAGLAASLALIASAVHADCLYSQAATFPLTPDTKPTIEVTINGAHVHFVVDTGAEFSAVSPEIILSLRLPQDRHRRTTINTVDGKETRANVILQRMEIADLKYDDRSMAVMPLRRSDNLQPVAGLLGADILSDFDIEFDMPRRTMTFYHVSGCQFARPPWTGRYQTLRALQTQGGRLLFPIDIEGHPLTALFDTGADRVLLSRKAAESLGVTEAQFAADPTARVTSGGSGSTLVRQHTFALVKIGDEVFHHIPIGVAEIELPEADLLVGAPYMKTRRFLLSYSTNALFVQREQTLTRLHDAVLPPPVTATRAGAPPNAAAASPARN